MSFLEKIKTLRKQPKEIRSLAFTIIMAIFIPITVLVLVLSLYQTLQHVSLNPDEQIQPPSLGQRLVTYSRVLARNAIVGSERIKSFVIESLRGLHMKEWALSLWDSLRGKPEIKIFEDPHQQSVPMPIISPDQ